MRPLACLAAACLLWYLCNTAPAEVDDRYVVERWRPRRRWLAALLAAAAAAALATVAS